MLAFINQTDVLLSFQWIKMLTIDGARNNLQKDLLSHLKGYCWFGKAREHCSILVQTFNALSLFLSQHCVLFCMKQTIQLWQLLMTSLFHFNKPNYFSHCYKKHLKCEDEVMKRVSPIIQCSIEKANCPTLFRWAMLTWNESNKVA